jgi:hypothetical protein
MESGESRSAAAVGTRVARGVSRMESGESRSAAAVGTRVARGVSRMAVGARVRPRFVDHYAVTGREWFHKCAIREEIRA